MDLLIEGLVDVTYICFLGCSGLPVNSTDFERSSHILDRFLYAFEKICTFAHNYFGLFQTRMGEPVEYIK